MIILVTLLLFTFVQARAGVTEIATGSMLGPRYEADRFYIRVARRGNWKQTYAERGFRGQAHGKLMMIRTAQGLFDDERSRPTDFDPERNTERLIEALDVYKAHGVLAVSVSLQGADPGYSGPSGDLASGGGTQGAASYPLVSAFRADGSLKPEWMNRLDRLLTEADRRNMVVCLIYFDSRQDQDLESPEALVSAARNITDWLIEKDFRNVIVDVADEWDLAAEVGWDLFNFVPDNIALLVDEVRERFHEADFTLPIGASTSGTMTYPASLARLCDVVLVHGDGNSPQEKLSHIQALIQSPQPVWMVEDANGKEITEQNLEREQSSLKTVFQKTAGWGYMPWRQAEQFPFEYLPGASSEFNNQIPQDQREGAYFRAVLESIARLVLKKPPNTVAKKK
jgi:hypothetical protein